MSRLFGLAGAVAVGVGAVFTAPAESASGSRFRPKDAVALPVKVDAIAPARDTTWLREVREALRRAGDDTLPRGDLVSTSRVLAQWRVALLMQSRDSGFACPMPVARGDITRMPIPTLPGRAIDPDMPVFEPQCWNPLFFREQPDSQP